MSGWQLATDAAIWTLILGSIAVFGWFVAEVVRLGRGRRSPPEVPPEVPPRERRGESPQ